MSKPLSQVETRRTSSRRLAGRCLAAAALLAGASSASVANAQEPVLRFSDTRPGNVVATGNTLGLSNWQTFNGPGPSSVVGTRSCDSIGTFTSLDNQSIDNSPSATPAFPAGTTSDWTENGSAAELVLPSAEAEILYAELVWGGSRVAAGGDDVTAQLDTPVTLRAGSQSISVTPVNATKYQSNATAAVPAGYYMRSADVTAFVQQNKGGTYSVEGVPGTQNHLLCSLNAAGWTLVVAYRYDGEPIRNLSIFSRGKFVDENSTVDYAVSGFCAPPSGQVNGTIAISAVEGDSFFKGDQLRIAQTTAGPFATLSGPNNPADNFFCSQINGPDGLLDTSGTFGNRNHNAAVGGAAGQVAGARQGWDITTVPITSQLGQLFPGQTSAVLRTSTTGDSYLPTLAAIAIDINAPTFDYDSSTTTVVPTTTAQNPLSVGDDFTVTVKIVNEGVAPASDVRFRLPLPAGISLSSFTTNGTPGDFNGQPVTIAQLNGAGAPMGTIAPNQERTVVVALSIDQPQQGNVVVRPVWDYSYEMCAGSPLDEEFKAAVVTVFYDDPTGAGGAGGGGGAGGSTGEGGAGAAGGAGGEGGGGEEFFAEGGGLFCAAQPGAQTNGFALLGLGALALAGAVRRRRRG